MTTRLEPHDLVRAPDPDSAYDTERAMRQLRRLEAEKYGARFELRDDCGLMDEDLDLGAFYAENDLEPEIVNAIGALEVGQRANVAGGASGIIYVVRVA